ncbi:hypothetical protein VPH35_116843 [Triticum aestivum]
MKVRKKESVCACCSFVYKRRQDRQEERERKREASGAFIGGGGRERERGGGPRRRGRRWGTPAAPWCRSTSSASPWAARNIIYKQIMDLYLLQCMVIMTSLLLLLIQMLL